ncbi:flagellar basal body P-ring formation chaperone FlgA [Melioribacter sp. OK-6-Me]|uniref:flagellar basal body P-ring formation chaperone FlgA n=1 Tax=unclassified Melioribacter TaxID=2627329 RepID=UPI003ED87E95
MLAIFLIILLQLFPEDSFKSKLQNYLSEKLSEYSRFSYKVNGLPINNSRIEIDDSRQMRISNRYAFLPVQVYDAYNNISNSFITIEIELYKTVLTANRKIKKGEILNADMFDSSEVEITSIKGTPLFKIDEIAGKRSRTDINEGVVVTEEIIEPVPDIYLDSKVTLHVIKGNVDVSVEATARQEGRIGEIIRVITADNKIFKARIIDKKNVILED